MNYIKSLIVVFLVTFSLTGYSQSPTEPAQGFNILVENNATLKTNETEGAIAIGGDLTIEGSYQIAINDCGSYQVDGNKIGLLVDGKIDYASSSNGSVKINSDYYVKIGDDSGSQVWYTDQNNATSPIRITETNNYNSPARIELQANSTTLNVSASNNPVIESGLIDFTDAFNTMRTSSTSISQNTNSAQLTDANGNSISNTGLPNQIKINLADGINFLNITATDLNNVDVFTYNDAPSVTKILVINIDASGTFNWDVWNQAGVSFQNAPYILYNFYNTTELNIEGNSTIEGTIFAPFADINKIVNQSNIEGQVIGKSINHSGGQMHCAAFEETITATVNCNTANNTTSTAEIDENDTSKQLVGTPTGGTWSISSGGGSIDANNKYIPADIQSDTNVTITYTIAANGSCAGSTSDATFKVTAICNDPVNTVSGNLVTNEQVRLNISGVSVTDSDNDITSVRITVSNGTLDVIIRVSGTRNDVIVNGPGDLTITGTERAINSYLRTLSYTSNSGFYGIDVVTIRTIDSCNSVDEDSFNITVNQICEIANNSTLTTSITESETKNLTGTPAGGTWSITSGGGTIVNGVYTPANISSNTDVTIKYTISVNGSCVETSDEKIFTVNNISNPCSDGAILGTVTANDFDADGINNLCDLDDDNDGILDTDEGCGITITDVSNFNINKTTHSANLNSYSNGFGLDILKLDNSFSITVNGAPLFSGEIELASAFTPLPQAIVFSDGDRFGANGMPQIWQMGGTANPATPLIRLTVAPDGSVQFSGSKTLNGTLEPMELANGITVNPITWSATNTIVIDQVINGQTYAIGSIYGYGIVCIDTDKDGTVDSLDTDSDNDGCPDATEGAGIIATTGTLNGGSIGGSEANFGTASNSNGIPTAVASSLTTGQVTTTAVIIAEQITIDPALIDKTVNENINTSFDANATGVKTTTFNAGSTDYTNPNGTDTSASLSYKWFKNSDPNVILSTDVILNLTSVTNADAGDYTVQVSGTNNSCPEEKTVTLTINPILGSIGDLVWFDTDGDGIKDAGESGLAGASITLDPGTQGNLSDDIIISTDVNGNYLFDNLPDGDYVISVDVSTVTSGLPTGVSVADLVQIFDADGLGTPSKSYLTIATGENNLDQDFAYAVPSGGVTGGNGGGVESESLGDAISKIYVGRKKNSVPTVFVKSDKNSYNKEKLKQAQPYQGRGQTMLDMFPTELVAGNTANVTSPTDILDYTIADEVLSVDFSLKGEAIGVVLGIKTSDKIYNHTKASCDRLRGAEILNIQTIQVRGYNFLMQGIKQRNGVIEYAISFATAKNNNDSNYTIQTNWYVNNYTKFNDVYNFQVWSTKPADTQKLVGDILDNLQAFIPVNQTEVQKIPETYASKIFREKDELIVQLRSTEENKTAEISMVELYSETANNIKHRNNAVTTEIQQALRLDIADGYEYEGLIEVDGEVEDAFYHADGNWGLDYDKQYTEVKNYFVWNDFDREYQDDEYSINRNVEIKATSEYDYLTVYKSLLPGTLSADYSEYKYLSFTAKGSGLMELGLVKSSIENWKEQYRVMVDLSEEEQTYYVPFDIFTSTGSTDKMTAEDLTTIIFTFLPVEANTKELDLTISDVKFAKSAKEGSNIIGAIEKFENNFIVYPNPSQGNVNLMLFTKVDADATVTLTDITGKVIYRGKAQLTEGKNELDFNFKVKPGVMLLKVSSKQVDYGTTKVIFR